MADPRAGFKTFQLAQRRDWSKWDVLKLALNLIPLLPIKYPKSIKMGFIQGFPVPLPVIDFKTDEISG